VEVLRRFLGAGDEPNFTLMIVVSLVAFAGNVASLFVLQRTRSQDANIKASQIFTSNDVLVNIGVIVAGVLVYLTGSKLPDLVVGAVVFCLVGYGAFRILKLSR
jgi:Co/Zn/Cd efflux system component